MKNLKEVSGSLEDKVDENITMNNKNATNLFDFPMPPTIGKKDPHEVTRKEVEEIKQWYREHWPDSEMVKNNFLLGVPLGGRSFYLNIDKVKNMLEQ